MHAKEHKSSDQTTIDKPHMASLYLEPHKGVTKYKEVTLIVFPFRASYIVICHREEIAPRSNVLANTIHRSLKVTYRRLGNVRSIVLAITIVNVLYIREA